MQTSSPSFGMALKQRDIIDTVKRFPAKRLDEYTQAAKQIHKSSNKAGFDVIMSKGLDYTKPDEIIMTLKSKKHPEVRYKKIPLTIQELKDESLDLAEALKTFFAKESKRLKNVDKMSRYQ